MKKFIDFLLILILIAGFFLLIYPTAADYWNSMHQTTAIATYVEAASKLNDEYDDILAAAQDYNTQLAQGEQIKRFTMEKLQEYYALLNIGGDGMMGFVTIPSIDVKLPIYHGTDDAVLSIGAGHLEWTSLPVGGFSSHCAISGHRGLPSARLFTDLDRLREGERFTLSILDEVLTYEIDKISIVDPEDTKELEIVPGMDYVSLVTCTPYGINSHRLIVRGHRVETEVVQTVRVSPDGVFIDPMQVAPFAAVPILIIVLLGVFFPGKKRRKDELDDE